MHKHMMDILQVNTSDVGGGAENVAADLHMAFIKCGHNATFIVGRKRSTSPNIYEIRRGLWERAWRKLGEKASGMFGVQAKGNTRGAFRTIVSSLQYLHDQMGYEYHHYPYSQRKINNFIDHADIVHFHNLHGNYFDLKYLPVVSRIKPTLITLHDEYLYTGHCACTLGCNRWKQGCGNCPHLDVYPAVERDTTQRNWWVKQRILSESNITLVSPSEWLASRAKQSFLKNKEIHIIPNGVDVSVFQPGNKHTVRENLKLPQDAFILLYVASKGRNSHFKDYEMLDRVVKRLGEEKFSEKIVFLTLGGARHYCQQVKRNTYLEIPFINEQSEVVKYYQSCDLYIHTAKTDNFPLVILEAMACGKPIVATNAGGIPEQIRDGINGYIVQVGDDRAMVDRIKSLIQNSEVLESMSKNAVEIAQREYKLEDMVNRYCHLYKKLIHE